MQHVVVVGAGPAGLSAALSLKDRGLKPVVIDSASEVGASWRCRYDRLRLNTGRQFSHLPGRRYPRGTPVFPTRDQVVEHLDRHAREEGIELRLGTRVERIVPSARGWRLTTTSGDVEARVVIVATGFQNVPVLPDAVSTFTGTTMHSSEYRNAAPLRGLRVLVVGSGSSGMEIAHDLSTDDVAGVWLSVRTPPNLMRRAGPGGLPGDILAVPLYRLPPRQADRIAIAARRATFGDLGAFGLPIPPEGPFTRAHRRHVAPTLVDPEVVDAVRKGLITVVPAVTAFERGDALLADGSRLTIDAVVAATGYRAGLEPLVGHLGVLNSDGSPIAAAPAAAADGLYFLGLSSRPSLIGHTARQSRTLARDIASA